MTSSSKSKRTVFAAGDIKGVVRMGDTPFNRSPATRKHTATINTQTRPDESVRLYGLFNIHRPVGLMAYALDPFGDMDAEKFVRSLDQQRYREFLGLLAAARRPLHAADATPSARQTARGVAADWLEEHAGKREWVEARPIVLDVGPLTHDAVRVRLDRTIRMGDVVRTYMGYDAAYRAGAVVAIRVTRNGRHGGERVECDVRDDVGRVTVAADRLLLANLEEWTEGADVVG